MTLSRAQFTEWKENFRPGADIRVPRSRFTGLSGLAEDFGIKVDKQDPYNTAETISNAVIRASNFEPVANYPINMLMAQHHINRTNARKVFESIKTKGYDVDEPILAVGDEYGATIINGHHRALAARAAGMRDIPTVLVPYDSAYRHLPY